MNTHIQKLAQEAGLYVDVNGKPWPRNMNGEDIEGAYQKFARLIIRECALTAGLMEHEGRKNIGAQILDNFGIDN
jgi:hypothetical protein